MCNEKKNVIWELNAETFSSFTRVCFSEHFIATQQEICDKDIVEVVESKVEEYFLFSQHFVLIYAT